MILFTLTSSDFCILTLYFQILNDNLCDSKLLQDLTRWFPSRSNGHKGCWSWKWHVRQRVPKPTPINASQLPTLYYLERFPWCRSTWAHIVMVLGAISGAISNWPPLPPYRVSNMLHYISSWFKVGLGWLVGAYSSHSIHRGGGRGGGYNSRITRNLFTKPRKYAHKAHGGSVMDTKGVGSRHKGGQLTGRKGIGIWDPRW